MATVNKDNFTEFGVDFSRFSTPHLVAGLLGFNDVHTKSALGFRLHWLSLKTKGIFDDCHTVGEHLNAYINHHITGEKR